MSLNRLEGDLVVTGAASFQGGMTLPASCVGNTQVAAYSGTGNAVAYTKLQQMRTYHYMNGTIGTAEAAADTKIIFSCVGAVGTIVSFKVYTMGAVPTGDKAAAVDLKKSTAAGAFASVLSATVTINSSSVARTRQSATISASSMVVGDFLQVVVTVSGSTNSYPTGLCAELVLYEDPA